jgi:hypothetical protein
MCIVLQKKEGDDYSLRPLHYITCFRYSDTRVKTNGSSSVEVVRRECAVGHVAKKLLGLYKDACLRLEGERTQTSVVGSNYACLEKRSIFTA